MTRFSGRLFAFVAVAILLGGAGAQAAIIASSTLVRDPSAALPFTAPDAALGSPWVAYRLSLTGTNGDLIQAVEATISGQLHQRWGSSSFDGVYDAPTGNSTNQTNGDSHFLASTAAPPTGLGMLFASGPVENNPASGSPLSPSNNDSMGWGVGTSMSATFGTPGAGLSSMDVAYIVIPKGSEPNLSINVSVFDPEGNAPTLLGAADFGFGVVGDPPVVDDLNLSTTSWNQVIGGIVPTTDVVSLAFDDINNPTFTPFIPGQTVLFDNLPTLDNAGNFLWDTTGTRRGTYAWAVTGTNPDGTDGGLVSVEVTRIPEPASIALLGLALVGFAGFRRK